MKEYQIWSEGFRVMEGSSGAILHGHAKGVDLNDACKNLAKKDKEFAKNFSADRMAWWGCKIYDNETDARKTFG